MSNQTPAWIIALTNELIGHHGIDAAQRREVQNVIGYHAARAPDAKALAEALEDGLQLFDGPRESTRDWYTGRIEIRKRMVEALAAHQAAHPKVSA